jgi:ribosomal protein S20
LKYDEENPKSDSEVKSIVKDLVAAVEQDIPKVRNFLKEEAEKKVKEILENPAKHLDKETRRKALAGKTKGKTSIINLLVRQKIIVEDK